MLKMPKVPLLPILPREFVEIPAEASKIRETAEFLEVAENVDFAESSEIA